MARITYRPEIDGLRALAVVPVILFHAGYQAFRGGFVGVDVFFVISGFLITSLILAERRAGSFTFLGFYERRARRILPALFAVMFVCLPFAWLWLFPADMRNFSQSVTAVCAFVSNVWLWQTSGYFDTSAELKPLLHTWTLGVEEQFYLLFPVLLLLAWRFGRRRTVLTLSAIGLAAFFGAYWGIERPVFWIARHRIPVATFVAQVYRADRLRHPETAAFYLLPARAWELLIGALLAILLPSNGERSRGGAVRQTLSVAGLLLIGYAVVSFDESSSTPIYLLAPTVGTALIVACATPETFVGRMLAVRPLVGLGLISYSAYLWHQPLFAFARHRSLDPPRPAVFAVLAVLAIVLGWLTWIAVERPFRDRRRFTRSQIFAGSAVCTAIFAAVGVAGQTTDGFAFRVSPHIADVMRGSANTNIETNACDEYANRRLTPPDACVFGNRDAVVAAVVGDSHANALAAQLGEALETKGLGVKELAASGCPCADCPSTFDCEYADRAYDYLRTDKTIHDVVIAGRWTLYLKRTYPTIAEMQDEFVRSLASYVALNKRIILLYPLPEVGVNLVNRNLKEEWFGRYQRRPDLTIDYAQFASDKYNRAAIEALDRLGEHPNLIRIRQDALFCNRFFKDRCAVELNGVRLYYDESHLSNAGARMVADEIAKHISG